MTTFTPKQYHMFERIINLLVIEGHEKNDSALSPLLKSAGHNVFIARSNYEALKLLNEKQFVLIFFNIDLPEIDPLEFIKLVNSKRDTKNVTIILTSKDKQKVFNVIDNTKSISVDYMIAPYLPSLVKAKINVYKKLHFRHLRVSRLLESILPSQTLTEYGTFGKSSPKRKDNCSVLFTDFVSFTKKTKNSNPEDIVKLLDYYFSAFDEIMQKYKLEKIKTIGDAYMAAAGVTESEPFPAMRTALAALEIRNFMENDILTRKALQKDHWEIRIGIHCGSLVAGVVGKQKFSFDVWGDTVNVAARCEQNSLPQKINVSSVFYSAISDYFECTDRGSLPIKNAGEINMYFLDNLKATNSLYGEGKIPNADLRDKVGLPRADFKGIRSFVLNKLKSELDDRLTYHSIEHTKSVEYATVKYAKLEKLSNHDLFLVQTAAIFHDVGFLVSYSDNEKYAVELLRNIAPHYGYDQDDINRIESIILSTRQDAIPKDLLEKIMCDADLDYLGRPDYHQTAAALFTEIEAFSGPIDKIEQIEIQIDYLENKHHYHTISAKNVRDLGKKKRIAELKMALAEAKKNPSTNR